MTRCLSFFTWHRRFPPEPFVSVWLSPLALVSALPRLSPSAKISTSGPGDTLPRPSPPFLPFYFAPDVPPVSPVFFFCFSSFPACLISAALLATYFFRLVSSDPDPGGGGWSNMHTYTNGTTAGPVPAALRALRLREGYPCRVRPPTTRHLFQPVTSCNRGKDCGSVRMSL